jgi:hypothetical protein
MIGSAVGDNIKATQFFGQSNFIVGISYDGAYSTTPKFRSKSLPSLKIEVGNNDFFKVTSLGQIARGFRAHRAAASEYDYSHRS